MSYFDTCSAMPRDEFTVQHANLSEFANVLIRPRDLGNGPNSRAYRRACRSVQNPRRMFWRKDGQVTVTGANKANTVTFSPKDMILVAQGAAGNNVILRF